MRLFETRPGRWAARDTDRSPARGIVTELPDGTGYRAEEFHVTAGAGRPLGDHESLDAALAAIVASTTADGSSVLPVPPASGERRPSAAPWTKPHERSE